MTARQRSRAASSSLKPSPTRRPWRLALGHPGPQPHCREGGLDRVAGLQVTPVLGWEVVEGKELFGVVGDLGHRLGPLGAVAARQRLDRLLGVARSGASRISARALRARPAPQPAGSPARWRPCGPSRAGGGWRGTPPAAPPTAQRPIPDRQDRRPIPRRRRSPSSSAQLWVDSGSPSATATSSLVPSARIPTSTRQHSRACSSRTRKWTPSAQRYR